MAVFNKDALLELKVLIEKELEKGLPQTDLEETLLLEDKLTILTPPTPTSQPVVVRYQGRNYILPW